MDRAVGRGCWWLLGMWLAVTPARALDLTFPTPNRALLQPGGEAAFFQATVEGTTESGMFGCVRRDGRKFHEGIDIKCTQRDRRGEPIDPVVAASAGRVAFISERPGLSNYGRYIVLEHQWDGIRVFTLYAHLREVAYGLKIGDRVTQGQRIATLGHSTNTREGISVDRAHLHFEVNFMMNPYFHIWFPRREPKAPPFGDYNGQNLIGMNPAELLRAAAADSKLNFAAYLARQPVAFTVLVPVGRLPLMNIQPAQVTRQIAEPAAYEVAMTAWGMPVRIEARSREEVAGRHVPGLNAVSEPVLAAYTCRELVIQHGHTWQLTQAGRDWLELLMFVP